MVTGFTESRPLLSDSYKSRAAKAIERLQKSANFLGTVGTRQGLPILLDRMKNPASERLHTVKVPGRLLHPFTLTASRGDVAAFEQIVGMGLYDIPVELQHLIDASLIVDLGANIGAASVVFATQYPSAKVLAIEPHPRNIDILSRNAHPYGKQIEIMERAISTYSGTANLENPLMTSLGHHSLYRFGDDAGGNSIEVPTITPSEIVDYALSQGSPIGLLKVNVQGIEKKIFSNTDGTLLLNLANIAIIEAHDVISAGTSDLVHQAARQSGMKPLPHLQKGSYIFFVRNTALL